MSRWQETMELLSLLPLWASCATFAWRLRQQAQSRRRRQAAQLQQLSHRGILAREAQALAGVGHLAGRLKILAQLRVASPGRLKRSHAPLRRLH